MTRAPAKRRGEGRRGVGVAAWAAWVGLVGVAVMPSLTAAQYGPGTYSDLRGDYCRAGSQQCCPSRNDGCSRRILRTLCYCDQFCDRAVHPDCCPDYWEVCLGRPPPPEPLRGCVKDNVAIPNGKSKMFNCNKCFCNDATLECEDDPCMVDEEVMRRVNDNRRLYGWTATNYSMFWGRKASEGLELKTGTLNPELLSMRMYPILLRPDLSRIPRQFDSRTQWPGQIGRVRDQGWCGASWAFSSVSVAQDRLAVESKGNENVELSPQHLISCDRRRQSGCKGGRVDRAWQYLRRIGVVDEGCYPYESGRTGRVRECRIPRGANMLNLRCESNGAAYQRSDLYKMEPAYRISGKEEDIQWEIITNGPVQAMMKVQRDLFMYRGGVYAASRYTEGDSVTHSVRILGWGEEPSYTGQSTKYWLVANSWGTEWGENGLFRIRRGFNESDIETFVLAVRAQLYDYDNKRQLRTGRRRSSRRSKKYNPDWYYAPKRRH